MPIDLGSTIRLAVTIISYVFGIDIVVSGRRDVPAIVEWDVRVGGLVGRVGKGVDGVDVEKYVDDWQCC